MEIQQQNIYTEITQLYKAITSVLTDKPPTSQQIVVIETSIEEIRQKYSNTFDALNRQQEILNMEFAGVEMFLKQSQSVGGMTIKEVKEMDQYQLEDEEDNQQKKYGMGGGINNEGFAYDDDMLIQPAQVRIQKLKTQIDTIQKKISAINNGKGKWFDTDHKDFIKIYNRCNGIDKKIINQGMKILGMNQTQIMDHLQLYQNYLQLEKEKKLVSQQYRQIKLLQEEENREKEQQILQNKKLQEKLKKQKQVQERLRKKEQIEKYKQKKLQEKQKMIQHQQQQKQKPFKIPPIQPQKKKQIMERNRLMLENQQKKILQMKNKKQSIEKGKVMLNQQQHKSIQGKKNPPTIVVESKRIPSSNSINKTGNKPPMYSNLRKEK